MRRIGILRMPPRYGTDWSKYGPATFDAKPLKAKNPVILSPFATRQQAVNCNSASLQTKDREAVEISLPDSMHTGQIIMLTKMLTSSDLRFYDFEDSTPVERWQSGRSGS